MKEITTLKIDLIIQARVGSKRLPGKSLMDLAGEPLVSRIIERVKRCKKIDDIILAIPETVENLPLKRIGNKYDVIVFTGSENDLVDRYFKAAKQMKSDFICRLPADNATPEPKEIDKIVDHHIRFNKNGFSTNLSEIYKSGYPDGIGAEIFSFKLLKEAMEKSSDLKKREHIHLNFFDYQTEKEVNKSWCPISTIKCPGEYNRSDLILDINTKDQYIFMKELYEYLYPKNNSFTILDIIKWYDNIYLNNKKIKN